jgi:translation initiation factor 1
LDDKQAVPGGSGSIINLKKKDPFSDVTDNEYSVKGKVHIRMQQRKANKYITIVEGLPDNLNFKLVLSTFKKTWGCNGCVVKDEKLGKIMQLSGDQRQNVLDFLVGEGLCTRDQIIIHGA